jgi:pSer/pThr/pTyr-binding forkhead associated (FHA) protein
MDIRLIQMSELRAATEEHEEDAFVQRYPGAFLLAMGYLAAEEIQDAKRPKGGAAQQPGTVAFAFKSYMRHEAKKPHPLAGLAFFLRPTGPLPVVTIGRGADCGITIPDGSVSESHCRLEVTPEGVAVVDPGSTNGTSINLEWLEPGVPKIVADEDILSVGRYSFQLLSAQTLYRELQFLAVLEDFESQD